MACNCKSKVNKKYTGGKDNGREKRSAAGVFFHKILNVLLYLLVALFAIGLTPFALVFIFMKKALGKEAELKTPFIDKIKKINKNGRTQGV